MKEILRGDVFYASLYPTIGCEQGGIRPVLVVQNDTGNLNCRGPPFFEFEL